MSRSSGGGSSRSFQKKGRARVVNIPGTRPSVHNSQLLVSTGMPSLDHLLGGGLPVGTLLLLEEDRYDVYSKLFLKYYLAEGVLSGHLLTLASLDDEPQSIMASLPAAADREIDDEAATAAAAAGSEKLSIAWRYQSHSAPRGTPHTHRGGHTFDLTATMDAATVAGADTWLFDRSGGVAQVNKDRTGGVSGRGGRDMTGGVGREGGGRVGTGGATADPGIERSQYWSLLKVIEQRIAKSDLSTSNNKAKTNVQRLAVHSLGSPLWGWEFTYQERDNKWRDLTTFFVILRALLRSSFSVGLVTVPSHLFSDPALLSRLHTYSDFVVRLESFQGSDKATNPVFKDYHGLFHVVKLAAINSLIPPQLDATDWVFKLRRRRMVIEKLHLPPDLSETVSRAERKGGGGSGGLGKNLDF